MLLSTRSFLGRGPSYPLNMSDTGGIKYTDGIDRINQSLYIIFSTDKGSRLNMPEFGSDLRKYRFDPLDDILLQKLKYTIVEDVKRWEPRITLSDIQFYASDLDIDNNTLFISLSYQIINTTISANFVYPYVLGTYDTVDISYN